MDISAIVRKGWAKYDTVRLESIGVIMNRENHPAWAIYDHWRTNRLNEKYYSVKLNRLEKANLIMEVVIAFMAPGGAVSALWFWNTPLGSILTKVLLPVAAVVGILKPLLGLVDRIKRMEKCLSGYRLLVYDCEELIEELKRKQSFDKEVEAKLTVLANKKRDLIVQNPETKENKQLKSKITEQILSSLVGYKYYIPEDNNA